MLFKKSWRQLGMQAAGLWRTTRAGQWWDYKLSPMFSIFYATVFIQHASIASTWAAAIALLLGTAAAAAYVSVVNDVTDLSEDLRAGKSNRMDGRPAWLIALLVVAPISVGVVIASWWREDPLLISSYLCVWLAFSLYSVPPFRLKSRGILGLIADASGAHLFPTLAASLLAFHAMGLEPDFIWLTAVAGWALACGMRGIIWHQLYDAENDRKIGMQTFVVRRSPQAAVLLARYLALPIEAVALAVLLWWMQSPLPVLFLILYALIAWLKVRLWHIDVIVAEPTERYTILGREYYVFLLPLSILLCSAFRHPADWIIVAAHCLLFPASSITISAEIRKLLIDLVLHFKK